MNHHQTISDELKGISPLLAGIPGHTLFSVPDGYFDGLAERIMQQIRLLEQGSAQGELETIAPLLHTMSRKNVYAVPEGYFDNMVVKRPAARVMTMKQPRKWIRYAAAAVITGAIGTGIFFASKKEPVSDYEKYVKLDLSSTINKLSDTELLNYLDKNERLSVAGDQAMAVNEELPDVSKHIGLYSDEELKQYLNENADLELVKGEAPGGE